MKLAWSSVLSPSRLYVTKALEEGLRVQIKVKAQRALQSQIPALEIPEPSGRCSSMSSKML